MPTVEENFRHWQDTYDWPDQGEEWSASYGNSEALWWFVIYPRIHRFLPSETLLEIAPGYGRWTEYLRHHCRSLVVVDLSPRCIEACRKRFTGEKKISYFVNDGQSLATVTNGSVDFVFSFDSLVHAETDVVGAYLTQLANKLKPNGVGFLHHTHVGAYRRHRKLYEYLPRGMGLRRLYRRIFSVDFGVHRALSMSAPHFVQLCSAAGLSCINQEIVSWENDGALVDVSSTFTQPGSVWDQPNRIVSNRGFAMSAKAVRTLSTLYTVSR
jgi:hypothetical protein